MQTVAAGVTTSAALPYRPDVDGLRAIAVVAVVLFHLFPSQVSGGFAGVDVFFVISGYLISGIILNGLRSGTFTFAHFYERRIKRIFPALAVVLTCSLGIGWAVMLPAEFAAFGKHVLAAAGFASNLVFWGEAGYFDAADHFKPLLHLWSLGIEEQFYLLWPLTLAALYRSRRTLSWIAGLGIASFAANIVLTGRDPSAAFYLPVSRFWELLIGSGLACHAVSGRDLLTGGARPWLPALRNASSGLGFALLLGALAFSTNKAGFPGWYALLPTAGTGMLIAAGPNAWLNRSLLSHPVAIFVGLISYPLYLWHWPLLTFARLAGWQSHGTRLGLAALSVILAWITYQWIEAPLRFGNPVRWKPVLLAAAVGAIGLGGLGIHLTGGSGAYLAVNAFATDLVDTSGPYHRPCSDRVQRIEPQLNLCKETIHSTPVAAIFGDSHADSVFAGMAQADRTRGWLLIGNSSCPPVNGISVQFRLDKENLLLCQQRSEAATRFLIGDENIRTIVLVFFGGYFLDSDVAADHLANHYGPSSVSISTAEPGLSGKRDLFFLGIDRTITMLLRAGKKVVLMIDTPELPFLPRDAIRSQSSVRRGLPVSSVLARQAELRAEVERLRRFHPELIVYDPLERLCGREECPIVIGGVLVYRDSHHLSTRGSKLVAGGLLAAIDSNGGPAPF